MNNKKMTLIAQLYQRLYPPFCITSQQFEIFWDSFYSELRKSYETDNFKKINDILNEITYIQGFEIDKLPKNLECEILSLLYKIITTMPIKNYLTQINACSIVNILSPIRKKKLKLALPWRPLFNFVKYILIESDILPLYIDTSQVEDILTAISNFSPFFEKGSTKEIVQILLPRISPLSSDASLYLTLLSRFLPAFEDSKEYQDWLPDFITESVDSGSSERLTPFFRIVYNIMTLNISEDFTFLIPTIMSSFVQIIVNDSMPNQLVHEDNFSFLSNSMTFTFLTFYLSKSVLNLCFSPPTQKVAIDQLTTILNGVCDLYHPSISSNSPTMMVDFVVFFIGELSSYMREMTLENSIIPKELKPSDDVLHRLLKPIVDLHLMMIHTMSSNDYNALISSIRKIGDLDPSTLPRYFEFALQCIVLTDAECVAEQGWTVISACLIGLRDTPLFEQHIQELIELAINNMFIVELQTSLMIFFFIVFSIFPFNKNLVNEKFINFPFVDLSMKFITAIYDAGRSFPALQGKFACPDAKLVKMTTMALHSFFMGISRDILEALQPILKSHLFDSSLIHSFSFFSAIYNFYFVVADDSLRQPILDSIKKIISSNPDVLTIRAMVQRFLCASALSAKNFDDYKKAIDFVQPLTQHPEKKVRKWVFNSILNSFIFTKEIAIVKPTKDMLIPMSEFKYEFVKIPFTMNDIVPLFIDPFIEELMSIKDSTIFYEKLKEKKSMIVQMLHRVIEVEEGEVFDKSSFMTKSPFYIKELIKPKVPIREKFYKLILYGMDTLPNNVSVLSLLFDILYSLLYPILNTYNLKTTETEILKSFWYSSHSKRKYNIFELSNRIEVMNEYRHSQYHLPLSPLLKQVLTKIIPFGFSKFNELRSQVCSIVNGLLFDFEDFIAERVGAYLSDTNIESVDEILQFFTFYGVFNMTLKKEDLLCKLLRTLCMRLKADNQETFDYLAMFAGALSHGVFPSAVPQEKSEMWDKLIQDILEFIRKSSQNDRMLNLLFSATICLSLGFTKNTSEDIILYLVDKMENYDEKITPEAANALQIIFKRHRKITKIRKPFTGQKIIDMPPIITNTNKNNIDLNEDLTNNSKDSQINSKNDNKNDNKNDDKNDNKNDDKNDDKNDSKDDDNDDEYNEEEMSAEEGPSESLIQCFTEKYIDPLGDSLHLPENIYALDIESNGWHIYSDHYTIHKIDFWEDSPITSHLPNILMSSIFSIDENSSDTRPFFGGFWRHVATSIGPSSLTVLIPLFEKLFSESMNEATASSLNDLITNFMRALPSWPEQSCVTFLKQILGPYIIYCSQNPSISSISQVVFLLSSASVSTIRYQPLTQFLFDYSDMRPEGNIGRRRLFDSLLSIIVCDCHAYYTSIDSLFERFIQPFFENYIEYNINTTSSFYYLFSILIESTCLLPTSPKYSPEMDQKRQFLVSKFNDVIKNSDPTQKAVHQLLSIYLLYIESSSRITNKSMIPVFIDNVDIILKAVNSTDMNTEDLLEPSVCSFLLNPIFINESHWAVQIIRKIIDNFDFLSPPMQLKFIQDISGMLSSIFYLMSESDLMSLYELFLNLAKQIKNENVRSEVLAMLGLVLKYCPPIENMSQFEAAAIISAALIFDEVDDQLLRAFEIVKDEIERSSRANGNLLKNVVNKFWKINADHMLPRVSEILEPYRLLVAPAYIT